MPGICSRGGTPRVDALLDLAEVQNAHLVSEAIDLPELVAQAVRDAAAEAEANDIRADVLIPECRVLGEPTLLSQLVHNLVGNAVRHGRRQPDDGGKVTLRVQNTGPVVEPHKLLLLTEPFYRGQGRTRRDGDRTGHGLGLAIAEAIASAHGTRLVLTAGDEGGLTAAIELPLKPS